MIAGFATPTTGRVLLGDNDITDIAPHRRNMGMVFQNYSLFPHLTVGQNVEFPLRQRRVPSALRKEKAREALLAVELDHRIDAMPDQLSGGQQQRVALARALVFEPALLLMDEPFGALDRGLRERMQLEIRRIHQQLGVTILFVTHDQQEALTLSDRIAIFNGGTIEQVGSPEELYDSPVSEFVATFLGESTVFTGEVNGGVMRLGADSEIPVGAQTPDGPSVIVLRPERLYLGGGADGAPHLAGTVRDVVYLGADRRIDVDTAVGPLFLRQSGTATPPRPNDQVTVSWAATDAYIFPSTPDNA